MQFKHVACGDAAYRWQKERYDLILLYLHFLTLETIASSAVILLEYQTSMFISQLISGDKSGKYLFCLF